MCITTALIPSYCPSMTLVSLVRELQEHNVQCVCVNDGSGEEYDEIFRLLPENTVLLTHHTNKGKGAALKTGMKWIDENIRGGLIVTADADGQHKVRDILSVAKAAEDSENTLVLGVREFKKEDMPSRSWYGNRITERVFAWISGVRIKDTQSGLRAFHSSLIPRLLEVQGERYEYEMNELLWFAKNRLEIRQIPIEAVYEGNNECSHFRVFRDSSLIYGTLLKFSFSSFVSFLLDTALFALFHMLVPTAAGMAAANIGARIISASFNYEYNRHAVFKDDRSRRRSLYRYIILAGFILLCGTCILYLLNILGIKAVYAKILSEMILFLCSFSLQRRFVFSA